MVLRWAQLELGFQRIRAQAVAGMKDPGQDAFIEWGERHTKGLSSEQFGVADLYEYKKTLGAPPKKESIKILTVSEVLPVHFGI
jgi:hypothetical protein